MKGLVSSESVTHEEDKSSGWSLDTITSIYGERPHTTDDRADEVDVQDGVNIYHVEHHRDTQEAEPTEAGHHKEWMMVPRSEVTKGLTVQAESEQGE